MKAALLVAHSGDAWTGAVAAAVARRGGLPVRLDMNRYPAGFTIGFGASGCTLKMGEKSWSEDDFSAVWRRRNASPTVSEDGLDATAVAFMRAECDRALLDWLAELAAPQIDPPWVARAAASKLRQLRDAARFGLDAPRTWLGSDPDAARACVAAAPGGVIVKPFTPAATSDAAVFASRLSPEDIDALDGLAATPMIFQEEVPRRLEARLTLVGQTTLTVALDAARTQDLPDHRRLKDQVWAPLDPPADVVAAARAMADAYGLQYGAFDFLVTPDGRWVFLELNPWGECFWLDELGLDVSGAIADLLLDPAGCGRAACFAAAARLVV